MVNIHMAYTQPINPPDATPVLTREQIWKGMQRKIRSPTEFVPIIDACEVARDEGGVVKRDVDFKDGSSNVREVCTEFAPTKVEFYQEYDDSFISNIVSDGPGGTDQDLYMTYFFTWKFPDVQGGGEEEKELTVKYKEVSRQAVDKSIETLRKLAIAGEL